MRPADRTVVSIESLEIGSPKDELLVALRQLRADCVDRARPDQPSGRTLARVSADLAVLYRSREDLSCRIFALSSTAISEVFSGKRQGLQSFDWVASYVLSCQRFAVQNRPARRDQGATILPHWASIYAAHLRDVPIEATVTAGAAATAGDRLATASYPAAYQLPRHQQDFVLSHGPYGRALLARAQRGHPHARYRVAVLLATDPTLTSEAAALLIDVASTGHPLSLDLLDADRDTPDFTKGGFPSPRAAARCAWDLARTARDCGADSVELAFCRAAARGRIPDAALRLAQSVLAGTDTEAADWLGQLGIEPAAGRHHAGERNPPLPGY